MTLAEIKAQFAAGQLTKPDYIVRMHEIHSVLFDYAAYLHATDIARIDISDEGVIMTSRSTGIRMLCDPNDQRVAPIEILNFGAYEPQDAAMMRALVPKNGCMLDIGANFGWYTIDLCKTVPGLTVHAFEPVPRTYAYLQKNLALNGTKNAHAWQHGFAERAEDREFFFYKEGSGNASLANLSERKDVEVVKCRLERLDDFVTKHALAVGFIKCDVEGAELFVFKGGVEMLRAQRPIVFTEMLRKWAARFDYHPNAIIELFSELGYRCYFAHGAKLHQLARMTDDTVETNFFFLHTQAHAAEISRFLE